MANKEISELTAGTALSGTELFHGVQGGNSRKFTAADFQPGKGTSIASAATITLGYGNFFHVTGTTGITDIDFSAARDGLGAWLEFDGVLTITHNATTLNLPGQANITTAPGDRAYVVQDSGDNVHMLFYQFAVAPPIIITSWTAFTPTFTGLGTASSISMFSRRVGDTLEIMGTFVCGVTTATEARITIGTGLTIDATKVPSISHCGLIVRSFASDVQYHPLASGGLGYLTIGNYNASNDGMTSRNGSSLFSNGNKISINAAFPITGW